jgi:hypothetical protein
MKANTAIISLSLLLGASQPALPWGDDGHKTIALIAQQCLTRSAKTQAAAMLAADPDPLIRTALAFPEREIEQLAGLEKGFFNLAEVVRLATPKRDPLKALDMETGSIIEFPGRKMN